MADSPGLFTPKFIFTRTLTIDHLQVPSTQSNFPVLVRLSDPTLRHVSKGGHVQNLSGFDIGFYSDSGLTTKLKWEIERWNGGTGELVAWSKIASVSSASDTVFYLSCGDPSIVTDQSDAVNVWTNSFLKVFHMKDGTALSIKNSVSGNNGSPHGATAGAGQIDGCGSFASASSQYFTADNADNPTAITITCWVNGTSFPTAYQCPGGYVAASNNAAPLVKSTGKLACYVTATTQISYDGTGSHTLSTGTWYYLAMTYNSSAGLVGYVNAASDGTAAANGNVNLGVGINPDIGRDTVNGRYWNGLLDEWRSASVVRSADWITCEYNNQKDASTFVTMGAET